MTYDSTMVSVCAIEPLIIKHVFNTATSDPSLYVQTQLINISNAYNSFKTLMCMYSIQITLTH